MEPEDLKEVVEWLNELVPATVPFVLRKDDSTIVADGVSFPPAGGSKVVVNWRDGTSMTAVWGKMIDMIAANNNGGRFEVEFVPVSAMITALLDVLEIDPEEQAGESDEHALGWAQAINAVRESIVESLLDGTDDEESPDE